MKPSAEAPTEAASCIASLHVLAGHTQQAAFMLGPQNYTVGRSRRCDIVLTHPSVSRLHARLALGPEGRFLVENQQSRHGVFVDDVPASRCELADGSLLRFGSVLFRFQYQRPEAETTDTAAMALLSLVEHEGDKAVAAATEVLDRLPLAVLLVESTRVLLANQTARDLLRRRDGLRVVGQHLVTDSPGANRRLAELVTGGATADARARGFRVARQRTQPLSLLVAPLESAPGLGVIFVHDPDTGPNPPARLLEQLYGLTSAEASVAVQLLQGLSLEEAARLQERSVETLRSHLKRVLAKTKVRRQSELIGLLLSGPAQLRGVSLSGSADNRSRSRP